MKSDDVVDTSRLDLHKLRQFAAIAEAGGLSAAATRLGLTRSALSHALAGLEESLGVALFHRVGRRLVLTREGARLQRAFGRAREALDEALVALADDAGPLTGTVCLGLHAGLSRFRLASVVRRFANDHPQARVRLVHGSHAELLHSLREARVDFALSLRGPTSAPGPLRSEIWCEQSLVLASVVRPRKIDFEAVSRLSFVDFFRGDPLIDRWVAHHFPRRRLDPQSVRVWSGSSSDLAVELVLAGVGACVLPDDLAAPYRRRGELHVIRANAKPLREPIWLHELASERPDRLHTAFRGALLDA